ncbi:MAG TPA: FAD-dependent oxidoreductase [Limnobacter sp.]|uniref:NAD(P)/FAD-dependent oxidoreductase n=1 Tax=Limnobacter sp. TaxID=2003368 RepID=UPI002E366B9B|nr:FAD-dependent oxidoreductase [Limnobacter sp.]HEX5486193.1 FAD-dependent oxidoreductase [Limnobacter sp.]
MTQAIKAQSKPKVAVIGGGISGLTAAYQLRDFADVTLFEANDYIGGHTNTVDIEVDGTPVSVDTGFLVYNERTYPNLIQLFKDLDVETVGSDMSFSVCLPELNLEWAGTNLNTVFAQRRNLFKPRFLRMLLDILKFNKEATSLVTEAGRAQLFEKLSNLSLGQYLDQEKYSKEFRDWYLVPMAAAIWSCPTEQMLAFPLATFVQFCHNHGLLQVENRPRWFTVKNGARNYVHKMLPHIPVVHASTPVSAVDTQSGKPVVHSALGALEFDAVVMACHSDQAHSMLKGNEAQRAELSKVAYQPNVAYLHTDAALMPKTRSTWSSWNYLSDVLNPQPSVSVTYWSNSLQPLPVEKPIFVTLNPIIKPNPELVYREIHYSHPVFDLAAIEAQKALAHLQGLNGVYLAGAWMKYGFHEDGHTSGLNAADALRKNWQMASQKVA